jgi:hypothetical protein
MQVDPKQLQQGASQILEKLRTLTTEGTPADHVITLLESIEADAMVAEMQSNVINAVAKHLPERLPGF